MKSPSICALLLAAGSSVRMGGENKLLLPIGNCLIIQHLIKQLVATNIDELIVVLGHEAELVKAQLPKGIRTVVNEQHLKGMTTSIQAGVQAASTVHDGFMICLGDQILMETEDYNYLIEAWRNKIIDDPDCIVQPVFEKQKGNPVIFSSAYKNNILAHQELNGCKEIVRSHREHLHLIEMANDHVLKDVDTQGDYLKITKR